MKFRQDINGLRAVAVLSVVLYHFNFQFTPGGFVGVDIFFVISGFLMTGIIVTKSDEFRFSFLSFYYDRAKRIIPALSVLCLLITPLGFLFLSPSDYITLSNHVIGSELFYSNILYWNESGYFDSESTSKWLLHTWSLSVEWQFYILYPIIIFISNKIIQRKRLTTTLFILLLISFIASCVITRANPSAAFYLIPTRAWEMIAGGLVFLCFKKQPKRYSAINITGMVMICVAVLFFKNDMEWPGYYALIPVLGTMLCVISLDTKSFLSKNVIVQFIGASSYSIYLWHWPIFVYVNKYYYGELPYFVSGFVISILMGLLSYLTIEKIFKTKKLNDFYKLPLILFMIATTILSAKYVQRSEGFPERFKGEISELSNVGNVYVYYKASEEWRDGYCHSVPLDVSTQERIDRCTDKGSDRVVFLMGDSFAGAIYPGLVSYQKQVGNTFRISQFTDGNGVPFIDAVGVSDKNENMKSLNQKRLQAIKEIKPSVVVVSWLANGNNAPKTIDSASESIKNMISLIKVASPMTRVVIVGSPPTWNENLVNIVISYWKEKETLPPEHTKYGLRNDLVLWDVEMKSRMKSLGIEYISLVDELCNKDGCMTRVGHGAKNLSAMDWGHLTPSSSEYVIKRVGERIIE